jgi:Concanavalin A-like lectin/glucanases superfamily
MKPARLPTLLPPLVAGIVLTLCSPSRSQVIYYDDFSDYTNGVQNATQCDTGLLLSCCGGDLPGWTKGGQNAIHAVNLNGANQYAAIIWNGGDQNVITMSTGIEANAQNSLYKVSWMAGPAVYANCAQATTVTEALVISVLRADGTVLAAYTNYPGAWAGTETLTNYAFNYTGDGNGPVQLQITGLAESAGNGNFSGAINNVGVTGLSVTNVPAIITQPVGGTVFQGDNFSFRVVGNVLASTYQWLKNGTPIAGATTPSYSIVNVAATNAGNYAVVVGNPAGSVTSQVAVLTVKPYPTFATYGAAVLADQPIHYYPLNETGGTMAADLGSLATTGGTYNGGFTLGQPTGEPSLGFRTCVRFDGQPGTYVDLGLFHLGQSMTAEAWVNLDPSANHSPSYHEIVGRVPTFVLDFSPGDDVQYVAWDPNGGQAAAITKSPALRGQWHYLVGEWDGSSSNATVWVDGVQGPVVAGPGLADAGPTPDRALIAGSRDGTNSSFNFKGLIAQVAIYTNALSPAQIRAHFRSAVPPEPPLISEPVVALSWSSLPPGFVLQAGTSVAGPYTNYMGLIYASGYYFTAPVAISTTNVFFQLSGQAP